MENAHVHSKANVNKLKAQVLRRNILKTQGKHRFCVGTYWKRKENYRVAREPIKNAKKNTGIALKHMENAMETHVLRWNHYKRRENTGVAWNWLKTQWKHLFCVGTYGKHKENKCVASEPKENETKIQMLLTNLWQTQSKHMCCIGTYRKRKENTSVAWEQIKKRKESTGFA